MPSTADTAIKTVVLSASRCEVGTPKLDPVVPSTDDKRKVVGLAKTLTTVIPSVLSAALRVVILFPSLGLATY